MSKDYNPFDWYWRADDGRVFSSARGTTVAAGDAVFVAWGEDGTEPTRWPRDEADGQTDAALQDVLTPYGLHVGLAPLKGMLKAQVDATAEALRLTLITPGSGQAMEYQEAYAQAQAALAVSGTVKASDYPMLAATIGVDIDPETGKPAADVLGVARSVKAAYEAYLQAGAAIRGARLLAKAEIDAAADAITAQAVFAAIQWPALGA